jgi:hypothetical protein
MAADPLTSAWRPYRDAVRDYYEIVGPALSEDRELDADSDSEVAEAERALQDVVERSQAVTEIGEAQLRLARDAEYDRVAIRLLAAGAVDIAVACEALRVCPDPPVADPAFITEEHQTPRETALDLLARADELFDDGDGTEPEDDGKEPEDGGKGGKPGDPVKPVLGGGLRKLESEEPVTEGGGLAVAGRRQLASEGGDLAPLAGGCLDPEQIKLVEAIDERLKDLVGNAAEPGLKFASGAVSGITAGFHITAAAEPLERLGVLAKRVGVIKRRLVRLLASGFQKLMGVSGATSQRLVGQGLGVIEGEASDIVERRVLDRFRDLLGWLVRYQSALTDAESAIRQQQTLRSEDVAGIAQELWELTQMHHDEMVWTGRTATWLSWAAPFISTLAVPVGGPLLVVGLNALGAGFVIYTLDVRVDGHGLPARVRSVAQIVNDGLANLS